MASPIRAVVGIACLLLIVAPGCGNSESDSHNTTGTAITTSNSAVLPAPTVGVQPMPNPAKLAPNQKPDDKSGETSAAAAPDKLVTVVEPLYFDRELTTAELIDRPLRELSLMRNTIYARGGNKFRKQWIHAYFSAQPWYQPRDELDTSSFTEADWKNAKTIAEVERSFSKDQLNARKDMLLAAIGATPPTPEQQVELELLSRRLGKWLGPDDVATTLTALEDPTKLDELLTLDELQDMSRKDLRLLRNTIYARKGYMFKSSILAEYFVYMDWYKENQNFSEELLSSVDWKNIKLIQSVENELGGPMTDNEHGHAINWFDGA